MAFLKWLKENSKWVLNQKGILPLLIGGVAGYGLSRLFGGKKETPPAPAPPPAPEFTLPEWSMGLPEETLGLIRGQIGQQLPEPSEFGITSQALQGLLQQQPGQFQLPITDIQQALAAQQRLQLGEYQKQIRPMLAQQGQLDSSYYTNLIGDFLRGQQAQTYGTTADLLTQQALQNLQTQRWLPGFQAGVAGQLAGLGGQRAGIGQYNLQLPFSTTIPALQGMYQTGLGEAGQQYQANLVPYQGQRETQLMNYQSQLQQYQMQEQQKQQLLQLLGQVGGAAVSGGVGGMAGLYGSGVGFGGGALRGLSGYSPQMAQMGNIFGNRSVFNPQWSKYQVQ